MKARQRQEIQRELDWLYREEDRLRHDRGADEEDPYQLEHYRSHLQGRICGLESVLGMNRMFTDRHHGPSPRFRTLIGPRKRRAERPPLKLVS